MSLGLSLLRFRIRVRIRVMIKITFPLRIMPIVHWLQRAERLSSEVIALIRTRNRIIITRIG